METVLEDFRQQVFSNSTVTTSGSWTGPTDFGHKEITLFINITSAPTGTSPTITFTIQELDPGNETTSLGTSKTGATLSGVGTQILTLPVSYGGTIQVSWTVTGTTPSFTGVYATLINKGSSPAIYDQSGNGPAAVKPASTAAVATDPALVVAISPNNSITTSATLLSDRIQSGSIAALNSSVTINAQGIGNVGITITGSWSATLSFQGTIDGTNWFAVQAMPLPVLSTSTTSSSTAANAQYTVVVTGLNEFRVTATAYTSGTATVTLEGNQGAATEQGIQTVQQGTAANLQATATQGPAASLSGAWPQEITDGTNGPAAVKPASTAAAAADPSLVVALSPNSPLPAGSNIIGALSADQSVNVAQVAGATTATSATGVQKVGIVGGSLGATLDGSLNGGTAPTDGLGTLAMYNATQPSPSSGQTLSIQADQVGNLLQFPGVQFKQGIWTTSTSVNTVQYPTGTTSYGAPLGGAAVLLEISPSSAVTGGAVTIQGSYDALNNIVTLGTAQLLSVPSLSFLGNPYTFVAGAPQQFLIPLQGLTQVRAELTTAISGTGAFVDLYWSVLPTVSNLWNLDSSGNLKVNIAAQASGVEIVGHAGATLDGSMTGGTSPTNGVGVVATYSSNQPTPSFAQVISLQCDPSANLLTFPGVQTKSGSSWGTGTSLNTVQYPNGTTTSGQNTGAEAIVVQLDQLDSFSSGVVTFQGTYDGGNNWVQIPTAQVLNPQSFAQLTNPYTFVGGVNQPFLFLLQGFQQIRANLTTVITGSAPVVQFFWTVLSGIAPVTATNLTQVNGNSIQSAAIGVQRVGISGYTGSQLDAAGQNATAPAAELIVGGEYNTTPTTISSGNVSPLQLDSSGNLKVNINAQSLGDTNVNLAQVAGSSTATSASGVQKVGIVGNAGGAMDAVGQDATAPANELIVGGQYNTSPTSIASGNVSPLQLDSSGNLKVNVNAQSLGDVTVNVGEIAGSATATAASGVQKVGVVGNAGAAMDAAGQNAGSPANELIVGGQYNTTPSTISSGNVSPLQLDSSGNLKVNVNAQSLGDVTVNVGEIAGSATATAASGVQKVGVVGSTGNAVDAAGQDATSPAAEIIVGGQYNTSPSSIASGNVSPLQLDSSGNLKVNINAQSLGDVTVNVGEVAGSATATAASGVQKVGIVGNTGSTMDSTLAAGTAPTDGLGVLAQYNTTQPAPTNAQTMAVQADQSGNLLEFPGVQFKTGAAWTSSTAVNTLQYPTGTATIGAPLGATAIIIQLDQTTTLTGGAVTFQGTYDGINWVTIPNGQILNPQTLATLTNPYSFVASTQQPFVVILQGFEQIRLNLTTTISGTGSVTPYWIVLSSFVTVPLDNGTLTAGTAPANGASVLAQYNTTQPTPTNTQTVSLQSDQSGNLLEFPGVQFFTGAAWSTSTAVNTLQYPTGTATIGAPLGARAILVQLDQTTTLTGGAVTIQGTYDNGNNWVTIPTTQILNPQTLTQLTNPYSFVASTQQPFFIILHGFEQIRLNLTTTISGTGTVTPYWTMLPTVEVAPLTKGTQGGGGFSTQALKDAGRSILTLNYTNATSTTTTTVTVLTTLVQNSNYVSSTGVTAFQVPTGKILELQAVTATAMGAATTSTLANALQCVYVDIRVSTTNTTTALAAAPIVATLAIPIFAYQANTTSSSPSGITNTVTLDFPDGVQIPASDYVGITTHNSQTTINTVLLGVSLIGYVY